jgi:type IV pilus assembly protein PilW
MRLHMPLHKQSGFSIIELMIAITISLLLTAAVALLYTSSRASATKPERLGSCAGSRKKRDVHTHTLSAPGRLPGGSDNLGQSRRDLSGRQPPGSGNRRRFCRPADTLNDTLTVTYQGSGSAAGDDRTFSCWGGPVYLPTALAPFQRDVFSIKAIADQEPILVCNDSSGEYELVTGVESMHILFGEDTDNPRDMTANRYVVASSVENWLNVVSVRISILVRSPNDLRLSCGHHELQPAWHRFHAAGRDFTATAPTVHDRHQRPQPIELKIKLCTTKKA